jgi:DNA-binding transcriptional ArsR family regulator
MTQQWVRLPANWIGEHGLADFKWSNGGPGSDQVAALMILVVIAHRADRETGLARLTYDEITEGTSLSRAKVSSGLTVLEDRKLITRRTDGRRSVVGLANYDPNAGWAMLPAKSMYSGGSIRAFADFRLRRVVELDAMKLFLLIVQRRDRYSNLAIISYDKIEDYTGITRQRIKSALSFLSTFPLVYVEPQPSAQSEFGVSNAYRIVGIEPRIHQGTVGRAMIQT